MNPSILLPILLSPSALAHDSWTSVRPGVDWLHRSVSGGTPQDIQAVRIDLSEQAVGIRASSDLSGSERRTTTSTFARSVDALVAINGDWSDGSTPVGLAIGNGWQWHDHYSDPAIGGTWGYVGCDVFNGCTIDALEPLGSAWWFATPTIAPYRYYNAVGANGLLLLDDGARLEGCYDGCEGDTCRHPRSAVCLDQAGETLWFIVVDGRRSGASGMTCAELRDLAQDLGCWDAAMLDGGGSSTLWIDGAVRNDPSDGYERTVANHIGVVYTLDREDACRYAAGAWCEGTQLRTCNGNRLVNDGDCAAFGCGCQEDGQWAFCVDYRCPDGDGTASACIDATNIAGCTDGVYGEGDCAAFGLVCGSDSQGSACMDSRCEAGPHSAFCLDEVTVASCEEGVYEQTACGEGEACVEDAASARCQGPEDSDPPDPSDSVPLDTDDRAKPPGTRSDGVQGGGCSCHQAPSPPAALALLVAMACLVSPHSHRRTVRSRGKPPVPRPGR
jgi:hypothetical protein